MSNIFWQIIGWLVISWVLFLCVGCMWLSFCEFNIKFISVPTRRMPDVTDTLS